MKFSCEKHVLQSAVTIASRATASKSPNPALEGILISAYEDICVTGQDFRAAVDALEATTKKKKPRTPLGFA